MRRGFPDRSWGPQPQNFDSEAGEHGKKHPKSPFSTLLSSTGAFHWPNPTRSQRVREAQEMTVLSKAEESEGRPGGEQRQSALHTFQIHSMSNCFADCQSSLSIRSHLQKAFPEHILCSRLKLGTWGAKMNGIPPHCPWGSHTRAGWPNSNHDQAHPVSALRMMR